MVYIIFQIQCVFASLLLASMASNSSPPEDPIKCTSSKTTNCTITNSYGTFPDRSICKAGEVAYPTTEAELISVVAKATMSKRKMKVATRYSHSIPKLVCPDGTDGLLISTRYLNRTVRIDLSAGTLTVQSGVTLRQVISEAVTVGLALPYSPYWWGLTIGGILGTGAHGSSLWGNGSAVHDHVVGLRIVSPGLPQDGYVRVRSLDQTSMGDFNAARLSLGVLGVISEVTLKLQSMFKRSITCIMKNDSDLGDQAINFGYQHEFADITWYPSQRKVVYRVDDRVSSNVSGNGLNDFTGFRSYPSPALALIRTIEETQESLGDANGKCSNAKFTTTMLATTAYGLTNNGTDSYRVKHRLAPILDIKCDENRDQDIGIMFTNYPIVGYQNRLQASGACLDSLEDLTITSCAWDSRVKGQFFHQTTFSIKLLYIKSFIHDVQKLIDLKPNSMCGLELYNGVLMRYVKASDAYLGKQDDALDVDITYYRSKDPRSPRLYEDIIEEVEQIALFKYGALPHWGKNRNVAFIGAIEKYKNAEKFLAVKNRYDSLGLFSNEWTNQVLGLAKDGLTINKEGCALEGLCICSQDIHCAPKKGYFCLPGKVYVDARVCAMIK